MASGARRRREPLASYRAALVVAVLAVSAPTGRRSMAGVPSEPPRVIHSMIALRRPTALSIGGYRDVAVTPDGTRIVYRTRVEGRTHLLRAASRPLAGTSLFTDQSRHPRVISPDGAWVAFYAVMALEEGRDLGGHAGDPRPDFRDVAPRRDLDRPTTR